MARLNLEVKKLQTEIHRLDREDKREGDRSIDAAGKEAARVPGIINGGAALAILTLIGHLATERQAGLIGKLVPALVTFCAGVLLAAIVTGMRFALLAAYRQDQKRGRRWETATVCAVILSYVIFAVGCGLAGCVLLRPDLFRQAGSVGRLPGQANPREIPSSPPPSTLPRHSPTP